MDSFNTLLDLMIGMVVGMTLMMVLSIFTVDASVRSGKINTGFASYSCEKIQ